MVAFSVREGLCQVGVMRFWRSGDYVSIKFSNFVG